MALRDWILIRVWASLLNGPTEASGFPTIRGKRWGLGAWLPGRGWVTPLSGAPVQDQLAAEREGRSQALRAQGGGKAEGQRWDPGPESAELGTQASPPGPSTALRCQQQMLGGGGGKGTAWSLLPPPLPPEQLAPSQDTACLQPSERMHHYYKIKHLVDRFPPTPASSKQLKDIYFIDTETHCSEQAVRTKTNARD